MTTPEGKIERYFRDKCKENGILCFKFVSPGNNAVPDRVCVGHGETFFVEMKAPGKRPRVDQKRRFIDMAMHGAKVHVVDSKEAADSVIRHYAGRKFRTDKDLLEKQIYGIRKLDGGGFAVDGYKSVREYPDTMSKEEAAGKYGRRGA